MGIKSRIRWLERTQDRDKIRVVAEPSGEEFKLPEDPVLRLLVAAWEEGQGKESEDPLIELMHDVLERGEILRDKKSGRVIWPPMYVQSPAKDVSL